MNAIEAVMARTWAITPEYLQIIMKIANREISADEFKALQKEEADSVDGTHRLGIRGNVAILSIRGPITKYANLFTRISGASSLDLLMKDFNKALEHPDVKAIILDIDSPGGDVNGVNEFANAVYEARERKQIIAYAGGMAASAAYWIGSAARDFVVDNTAQVGSIGVVATYIDNSERLKKNGIKEIEIVSASSPDKRPDPLSDEGRQIIQRRVDAIQEVFVKTVARNRGVNTEKVLGDFGQGDVLVGENAVEAGMADWAGNLESLIKQFNPDSKMMTVQEWTGDIKSNNKQEKPAMDEKQFPASNVSAEWLKSNFPLVYETVANAGAAAERERIQGIHQLNRPGIEAIVEKAMFKSNDTPGDVALKIVEHDNQLLANRQEEIEKDAREIPGLEAPSPDDADVAAKAEQQAIDDAVVAGMNKKIETATV